MKYKEIEKLSPKDREKKLKELKLELIKSKSNAAKKGISRSKDIRKIIARISTLNNKVEEVKK